jgi:hypothetical protein
MTTIKKDATQIKQIANVLTVEVPDSFTLDDTVKTTKEFTL